MTGSSTTADGADGAPVALRMPYPRWRRWARSLRRRSSAVQAAASGGDPHDRVYFGYGLVLVALVYAPMLWSGLARVTQVRLGTGPAAPAALPAVGLALTGLAALAALFVARAGGPVWVTPAEATFVLGGQFAPRAVLWRRALLLVVTVGGVGAFLGTALAVGAFGLLDGPSSSGTAGTVLARVLVWGLAAAMAGQVPLALGVAAQCPRWRRAAWTTAVLLAVAGLAVVGLAAAGPVAGGAWVLMPDAWVLPVLALPAVASVLLVVRLLPEWIDVDATAAALRRSQSAGQGAIGGDAAGLRDVLGPRGALRRGGTFWPLLLRAAPLVARDVLGLRRRPLAVLGSATVGLVGVVLVLAGTATVTEPGTTGVGALSPSVAATAGAVLLYAASSTWADGLRELADQPVPGGLLPGRVARVVGGHLVVPVVVAATVAAAGVGLVAAAASGGPGVAAPVVSVAPVGSLAALLVGVLATRCWVAGASTVPVVLFSPMLTPNGDASTLLVGAWYLRGWLVVLGAAWLIGTAGPGAAPVLLALSALLVVVAVRRLERA